MSKNTGTVSINSQHNISFDFNDVHIEVLGMANLTELISVETYEKDGYIVLKTNYGDEPFDLKAVIEDLGLADEINIEEKLKNIEKFVIVK